MNTTPPRHSVSVSGVIPDDHGRVLLIRRRDNQHWEPPGGVLELDETIHDGLRREIREETGLDIEPDALTGVYKNMPRGIIALVFRCKITGGQLTPNDEVTAFHWADQADIRAVHQRGLRRPPARRPPRRHHARHPPARRNRAARLSHRIHHAALPNLAVLDQGGAAARRRVRRSRAGLCLGGPARRARAVPSRGSATDQEEPFGEQGSGSCCAAFLAPDCPARGHRV